MSNLTTTLATLNACLDNIKQFQQRYNDEQAKAARNQQRQQAYNNALSAWQVQNAQQLANREQGRRAPTQYIWYNGALINCNTT